MSLFIHAEFYRTVHRDADLPPNHGAELALAGRSNAGKSSVLNALLNRRRLARVSKTPGRTQAINFYSLGSQRYLVDLPGYGYAAVGRGQREFWGKLISSYLMHRAGLRGLFLICDARRSLQDLDHQLLEWFRPTGKPVHVLLTKADKLSRAQRETALVRARDWLSATSPGVSVQLFSSVTQEGVVAARKVMTCWMQ